MNRFRTLSAAVLAVAACGGPQKLGGSGATCFRDDDCAAGLICVAPTVDDIHRVCSNDPTPLVSMVEGPPATGGSGGVAVTAGAGGASGYAGSASGGKAGNSGKAGNGNVGGSAGGGGKAGAAGTSTGGSDTAGTAGSAPDGGAPP